MNELELLKLKEKAAAAFESAFDRFEFEKAQKAMEFAGWWWAGNRDRSPTVDEIKETVRRLFKTCMDNWDGVSIRSCSTGGYRVLLLIWPSGNCNIDIIFEYTSADQDFNMKSEFTEEEI